MWLLPWTTTFLWCVIDSFGRELKSLATTTNAAYVRAMNGVIYLHRRDLRLEDNRSLVAAAEMAEESGGWLLLLALWDPKDDAVVRETSSPRLGPGYRRYWRASVDELADTYRELGQHLVRATATAADAVSLIKQQFAPHEEITVVTPRVPGTEEANSLREISACTGIPVVTPDSTTLLAIEDVPGTFSSFRNKVERDSLAVPAPTQRPEHLPPPPPWATELGELLPSVVAVTPGPPRATLSESPSAGGRSTAIARLRDFVWDSGALRTYKETRNGLLGTHFSSRLSAPLAHGTLSAREVWQEVKANEDQLGPNESTYWLGFELLWRDFFHFQAYAWGDRFFSYSGYGSHARPLAPRGLSTGPADPQVFHRWITGTTGDALVDAALLTSSTP